MAKANAGKPGVAERIPAAAAEFRRFAAKSVSEYCRGTFWLNTLAGIETFVCTYVYRILLSSIMSAQERWQPAFKRTLVGRQDLYLCPEPYRFNNILSSKLSQERWPSLSACSPRCCVVLFWLTFALGVWH